MADVVDPLARLWAETEAPARDLVFELRVEEAVARRALALDAAGWLGGFGLGGVALWGAWPGVSQELVVLADAFTSAGPVIGVAASMTMLAFWLSRGTPDALR